MFAADTGLNGAVECGLSFKPTEGISLLSLQTDQLTHLLFEKLYYHCCNVFNDCGKFRMERCEMWASVRGETNGLPEVREQQKASLVSSLVGHVSVWLQ